ncbi:TPA: restriction endonuclease subunit S [Vibrio diabolicus]
MTALSETKRYQAYPEYKDSGVEWLGQIPAGWNLSKIAWHFRAEKGKNGQLLTKEYCGLNVGEHPVYSGQTENGGVMGKINSFEFDTGFEGVLFSTTVGAKAMTLSHLRGKFSLSQNCMIIASQDKNIVTRFAYYHFQPLFAYERGLIPEHMQASFRMEDLYRYPIATPSVEEQTEIANFLDHETAKIDTLIEKQQQLIKLLKEKRQAVISHAVTKGLNPQAPMKDSGVEWCDYIPEHWRIGKLGYFARVGNGATPSRENQSFWNDGTIGWLNSSKVNDVIITEAEQFITPLALAQTSVQPVKANDLVIAITGEGQTRGRVAICQLEATINQHLASIRIYDDCLHHEFLFLWLSANYERIRFESTGAGSTKGAITCGDIKSYPIVIAPLSEQTEIINHIKLQNQHFSNLIAKADNQVQLLKERRTALISAAVTGKIDVRNWQAPSTSITKIPEGEV